MNSSAFTIWICTDCLMMHANGECEGTPDREPMNLLEGVDVTLGLMADEHHEDCDYRNSMSARDTEEILNLPERTESYECNLECEQDTFSTRPCDGCGSSLAGSRDAATVWSES